MTQLAVFRPTMGHLVIVDVGNAAVLHHQPGGLLDGLRFRGRSHRSDQWLRSSMLASDISSGVLKRWNSSDEA